MTVVTYEEKMEYLEKRRQWLKGTMDMILKLHPQGDQRTQDLQHKLDIIECIMEDIRDLRRENMDFSIALRLVKNGFKIGRKGWNGKGMFVVYQKGYPEGIPCNKQTAEAWGLREGELFKCEPYLQIKMVNGSHSMWVPSINDCLAEDWEVVK